MSLAGLVAEAAPHEHALPFPPIAYGLTLFVLLGISLFVVTRMNIWR
jgi:hypothetical protein